MHRARRGRRCGSGPEPGDELAPPVETLYRGLADNSVGRVIDTILKADLILIDEISFAPLDDNNVATDGESYRMKQARTRGPRPTSTTT